MLRQLGDKYEFLDTFRCEECGGRAPLSQDYERLPADDVQHEPYCFVGKIAAVLTERDKADAVGQRAVAEIIAIAGHVS